MSKIFESPDNGKTVYEREAGSTERNIKYEVIEERALWMDILEKSKTNPTLQQALDRVKMIYELSKDSNN